MNLACQISSSVYVSRNFCLIVFKHTLINSISSLCLVVVVITFPSCCIAIVFIFSTTRMSVLLVLLQSINVPFIWSSYALAFFSSYWISWSSWSNFLWILNYLFPIPTSELQNPKDQCVVQHIFIHTKLHHANVPLLNGVADFFPIGSLHIPFLLSWSMNEFHHLHFHGILVV